MKFESGEIVFECTGRKEYAYGGVVSPDSKGGLVYGYDGTCYPDPPFTQEEKDELAEAMKAIWERWRVGE